jgi:hypothetical protein
MIGALSSLLFAAAVALGVLQGRAETTWITRFGTSIGLLGVSNVLNCWPWFGEDPSTWIRLYVSGLFVVGLSSLAVHVVPFCVAWHAARWLRTP